MKLITILLLLILTACIQAQTAIYQCDNVKDQTGVPTTYFLTVGYAQFFYPVRTAEIKFFAYKSRTDITGKKDPAAKFSLLFTDDGFDNLMKTNAGGGIGPQIETVAFYFANTMKFIPDYDKFFDAANTLRTPTAKSMTDLKCKSVK